MMISQCKGKLLSKVAPSKLFQDGWYVSTKYDGNYIQIHKKGKKVNFYSAGNKEFDLPYLRKFLLTIDKDFILEAEFLGNSDGKLGDRGMAAVLTTYRTAFNNFEFLDLLPSANRMVVFDIIIEGKTFLDRMEELKKIMDLVPENLYMYRSTHIGPKSLVAALDLAADLKNRGMEGAMLKHISHTQQPGKRVNTLVKLKERNTEVVLCTSIVPGEGKYTGKIGALNIRSDDGLECRVGTGLSDEDRNQDPSYFMGKKLLIAYEQKMNTFIQPSLVKVFNYEK